MKRRLFIKTLAALLTVTYAVGLGGLGCGPPPDPKTQLLGKWKDTSNDVTRGSIVEFQPDGIYTITITLNGKTMTEKADYLFTTDKQILFTSREAVSSGRFKGARAVSALNVEFNGDTMILSRRDGSNPKTYERVQ